MHILLTYWAPMPTCHSTMQVHLSRSRKLLRFLTTVGFLASKRASTNRGLTVSVHTFTQILAKLAHHRRQLLLFIFWCLVWLFITPFSRWGVYIEDEGAFGQLFLVFYDSARALDRVKVSKHDFLVQHLFGLHLFAYMLRAAWFTKSWRLKFSWLAGL